MTPKDIAREAYEGSNPHIPWHDLLAEHIVSGWVISTEEYFLLARPVKKDAPDELILDPTVQFHDADCIHCYIAASQSLPLLWTLAPDRYEWVSYQIAKSAGYQIRYRKLSTLDRHGKRKAKTTT